MSSMCNDSRPGSDTGLVGWYSVAETRLAGRPVLAILRDGRPFCNADETLSRLQLDDRQARMLLTCLREIRSFVAGSGPLPGRPLRIESRLWRCTCEVVCHPAQRRPGGEAVTARLSIRDGEQRIELDRERAMAVLFVEADIEHFVFACLAWRC